MYHSECVHERGPAYIDARDYPAIEWHIEQSGKTMSQGRVGLADINTGAPLPESRIYRIFSMTKPLVAAVGVLCAACHGGNPVRQSALANQMHSR